jgi:hypothetical protein
MTKYCRLLLKRKPGLGCVFVLTISHLIVFSSALAQEISAGKPAAAEKTSSPESTKPLGLDSSEADQTSPVDAGATLKELGYKDPMEKVRATLGDPPGGKRISKQSQLWVDVKNHRVFVDGYVSLRDAPLEMFACPAGTKEHESIVATLAKANEVHAALLAVGAMSGTPVRFDPKYVPATGQRIRVWVLYRGSDGKFVATDAKTWVRQGDSDKSLEMDWVFAGSTSWTDPEDGKTYYQANSGELICVSNFGTAMMDLPIESSASNGQQQFMAFTSRIPAELTPVRLMLVPIPIPSDLADDPAAQPPPTDKVPDESLLPLKPKATSEK